MLTSSVWNISQFWLAFLHFNFRNSNVQSCSTLHYILVTPIPFKILTNHFKNIYEWTTLVVSFSLNSASFSAGFPCFAYCDNPWCCLNPCNYPVPYVKSATLICCPIFKILSLITSSLAVPSLAFHYPINPASVSSISSCFAHCRFSI
jgi:hypothetical protein